MTDHISTDELVVARDWYQQTNDLIDLGLSAHAKHQIEVAFAAVRIHLSHLESCHLDEAAHNTGKDEG